MKELNKIIVTIHDGIYPKTNKCDKLKSNKPWISGVIITQDTFS